MVTVWPSGLRRYVQVVFLIGVGSNPTAVILLLVTPNLMHARLRTNDQDTFHHGEDCFALNKKKAQVLLSGDSIVNLRQSPYGY
jgi:hypothetical protein